MKVSDLIQSTAFQNLYGIIVEIDVIENDLENEEWFLVHWFMSDKSPVPLGLRRDTTEWCRDLEIETRHIS